MLSYIKAASCISAITVEHIVLSLVPRRFFPIRKSGHASVLSTLVQLRMQGRFMAVTSS